MNERLKELVEEAESTIEFVNGEYCWPPDYIEKLMEIVIKECQYAMDCNKGSDQHQEWNRALYETIIKIDKHFGIEE